MSFVEVIKPISVLDNPNLSKIYRQIRKPQRLTYSHRNQVWVTDFQFGCTDFQFVSTRICAAELKICERNLITVKKVSLHGFHRLEKSLKKKKFVGTSTDHHWPLCYFLGQSLRLPHRVTLTFWQILTPYLFMNCLIIISCIGIALTQ